MANYNKIILIGNLTRDPQLSYLPSQTPVCEFGLAVNRRWRSQDGEQREDTCFVDCRAFGKQAETLNKYMAKGRQIMIEGRLTYDTWENQDKQKRSKHRVTIEGFQFLDSGGGGNARQGAPAQRAPQRASGGSPQDAAPPPDDTPTDDDGIPF